MVKGVLTLFLFLTISIPLSAQYILQGVVTDSLTKEPLPYASVRLKDTTEGTTTGSDGRFYFKTNGDHCANSTEEVLHIKEA